MADKPGRETETLIKEERARDDLLDTQLEIEDLLIEDIDRGNFPSEDEFEVEAVEEEMFLKGLEDNETN